MGEEFEYYPEIAVVPNNERTPDAITADVKIQIGQQSVAAAAASVDIEEPTQLPAEIVSSRYESFTLRQYLDIACLPNGETVASRLNVLDAVYKEHLMSHEQARQALIALFRDRKSDYNVSTLRKKLETGGVVFNLKSPLARMIRTRVLTRAARAGHLRGNDLTDPVGEEYAKTLGSLPLAVGGRKYVRAEIARLSQDDESDLVIAIEAARTMAIFCMESAKLATEKPDQVFVWAQIASLLADASQQRVIKNQIGVKADHRAGPFFPFKDLSLFLTEEAMREFIVAMFSLIFPDKSEEDIGLLDKNGLPREMVQEDFVFMSLIALANQFRLDTKDKIFPGMTLQEFVDDLNLARQFLYHSKIHLDSSNPTTLISRLKEYAMEKNELPVLFSVGAGNQVLERTLLNLGLIASATTVEVGNKPTTNRGNLTSHFVQNGDHKAICDALRQTEGVTHVLLPDSLHEVVNPMQFAGRLLDELFALAEEEPVVLHITDPVASEVSDMDFVARRSHWQRDSGARSGQPMPTLEEFHAILAYVRAKGANANVTVSPFPYTDPAWRLVIGITIPPKVGRKLPFSVAPEVVEAETTSRRILLDSDLFNIWPFSLIPIEQRESFWTEIGPKMSDMGIALPRKIRQHVLKALSKDKRASAAPHESELKNNRDLYYPYPNLPRTLEMLGINDLELTTRNKFAAEIVLLLDLLDQREIFIRDAIRTQNPEWETLW